jgi:hypothetical protein
MRLAYSKLLAGQVSTAGIIEWRAHHGVLQWWGDGELRERSGDVRHGVGDVLHLCHPICRGRGH